MSTLRGDSRTFGRRGPAEPTAPGRMGVTAIKVLLAAQFPGLIARPPKGHLVLLVA